MTTDIRTFITSTSTMRWKPLVESVDTRGIAVKPLRIDATGRATSFLLKFDPGASYPFHTHPAGEELFVLEGACEIEGATLSAGDYLHTPPGGRHAVRTTSGCVLFFVVPEEVEIVDPMTSMRDDV